MNNVNPNRALEILYDCAKLDRDRIEKGNRVVTYAEEIEHNEIIKPYYDAIKQALLKAQEQEKAIEVIKKHFNIKLDEETELNGNVWGRLVSIQAKEDDGTWDTTATANLVDYTEEFELLKEMIK